MMWLVYDMADSNFYSAHATLYVLLHWSCCLVRQPSSFLRLGGTAICVIPVAAQVSAIALDSVVSMDEWGLSPQVGLVKVTRAGTRLVHFKGSN